MAIVRGCGGGTELIGQLVEYPELRRYGDVGRPYSLREAILPFFEVQIERCDTKIPPLFHRRDGRPPEAIFVFR